MGELEFQYVPTCSAKGCRRPAEYKVAAVWSSGASRELKNYGLACDEHRISVLTRGRINREGLMLADGEQVGEVGLYRLASGEDEAIGPLVRLPEHDHV